MVEARKKDEAGMSSPISVVSQSSHVSDLPSPTTPTFSLRGHGRFPSSSSSLASSPVVRESMDGFGSGKRPLTEVKEEPLERDDDFEMVDCSEADINNDRKCTSVRHRMLAEYRIPRIEDNLGIASELGPTIIAYCIHARFSPLTILQEISPTRSRIANPA